LRLQLKEEKKKCGNAKGVCGEIVRWIEDLRETRNEKSDFENEGFRMSFSRLD
jgi:hypothetical protein